MKKTLTFILCSFFLAVGTIGLQANNKKEAEVTFTVAVHCDNCKKKIENSLPHEKGVKDLKVSVKEQSVWVKFDTGKTNKDLLRKAIEKLGFTATEKIEETKKATAETKTCDGNHTNCKKDCTKK